MGKIRKLPLLLASLCTLQIALLPVAISQESYHQEDSSSNYPKLLARSQRSIGGLFRRLFGRRKQTGFQGTTQTQQDYNSQSSSYYPSYFPTAYGAYPYGQYAGYGQYPGMTGQTGAAAGVAGSAAAASSPYGASVYPGYGSYGYGSYPQASSAYPTYGQSPYGMGAGGTGGLDFHSVLDQMVRAAGLAPAGDQEAAASSIQAKGDTPVFSFKKLYSFPFYLSSDTASPDGYNLQIPFMKKHHINRMAQEYNQRQALQQQHQQTKGHPGQGHPHQHLASNQKIPVELQHQQQGHHLISHLYQPSGGQVQPQGLQSKTGVLVGGEQQQQQQQFQQQLQNIQNQLASNPQAYITQYLQQLYSNQQQQQAQPQQASQPQQQYTGGYTVDNQTGDTNEPAESQNQATYYYGQPQSSPSGAGGQGQPQSQPSVSQSVPQTSGASSMQSVQVQSSYATGQYSPQS